MVKFLLPLCLLGVLILTSCGGSVGTMVENSTGKTIGEIRVSDEHNAQIFSVNGEERGKVRGGLVRDEDGGRLGQIVERDGNWIIQNDDNEDVGSLGGNGTECFGTGQEVLGRITADVDREAAGAACLIFFLQ